jgi:hypothetical protein
VAYPKTNIGACHFVSLALLRGPFCGSFCLLFGWLADQIILLINRLGVYPFWQGLCIFFVCENQPKKGEPSHEKQL